MSGFALFTPLRRPHLPEALADRTEYLIIQRPLHRVMAFTGRSIDDIVNDPVAKREVLGYYKLYRQIQRRAEARDLERQWNPHGL